MGIGRFAGDVLRGVEETATQVGHAIAGGAFDNSLRLGVTGLSQAGKTVFITSLVANLLDRGGAWAGCKRSATAASTPPICNPSQMTRSRVSNTSAIWRH